MYGAAYLLLALGALVRGDVEIEGHHGGGNVWVTDFKNLVAFGDRYAELYPADINLTYSAIQMKAVCHTSRSTTVLPRHLEPLYQQVVVQLAEA